MDYEPLITGSARIVEVAGVGVLAVIVAIRMLPGFTLALEASGRWPWQREATAAGAAVR